MSERDVRVLDPSTGVRESLDLDACLTDRQLGEMSTRPDMVVVQVSRAPELDRPAHKMRWTRERDPAHIESSSRAFFARSR
ncbi:hypothetical protein [Sorangium sp. So ce341]|uniref:hypothetical protein n=1 Tax=Sorangium sp. So ce341 TaxID=3133302 RepID=UPI003F605615